MRKAIVCFAMAAFAGVAAPHAGEIKCAGDDAAGCANPPKSPCGEKSDCGKKSAKVTVEKRYDPCFKGAMLLVKR